MMKTIIKTSKTSVLSTDLYLKQDSNSIISIEFPKNEKVRSRTVVSRSRARPTGKFPSWKMGRMIQWESCHELNAYRLLDVNPYVVNYFEQPLLIRYIQDGIPHFHYPDTLVQFKDSFELWEIKTAKDAAKPEYIQRTQFLRGTLPNLGYRYRLIIAEDLAREPRLSNCLILLKFGRNPVSLLAEEQLRQILLVTGNISWDSILQGAMGPEGRKIICRLVLKGVLTFDIEKPLLSENHFFWIAGNTKAANWEI